MYANRNSISTNNTNLKTFSTNDTNTKALRYQRLEKIGNGTYGEVYKAIDKNTGNIVAMKVVKNHFEKEAISGLTLREITSLKRCKHQNVIKILDQFHNKKTILIFEYMPITLQDLLYDDKNIKVNPLKGVNYKDGLKFYMFQLLFGLKSIHDNRVIH